MLIKLDEAESPQKGLRLMCNRVREPLPLPLVGLPFMYRVVGIILAPILLLLLLSPFSLIHIQLILVHI